MAIVIHGGGWKDGLFSSTFHIAKRVPNESWVPQRQDPVIEALHDASLSDIDLLARPHVLPPGGPVVLSGFLEVDKEFDGDNQRRQNDNFGFDTVDVELVQTDWARRDRVALRVIGGDLPTCQRTHQTPIQRESRTE